MTIENPGIPQLKIPPSCCQVVTGGSENVAIGEAAVVSGGADNVAEGYLSTVSGGRGRTAPQRFNWVAGELVQPE
jgi:hypothetical protein